MAGLFPNLETTVAKRTSRPTIAAPAVDVLAVFEYWRIYHTRAYPRPHDGMKEWQKVAGRLREGYSVDDLKQAIDGMHKSPFHCGENDRTTKYLSLELCLRDASKVEQFLRYDAEYQAGPILSAKTQQTLRAGQSWINRTASSPQQPLPQQPPQLPPPEPRRLTDDRR